MNAIRINNLMSTISKPFYAFFSFAVRYFAYCYFSFYYFSKYNKQGATKAF